MPQRQLFFGSILAGILALSVPSSATVVRAIELGQLIGTSERVIVATAVAAESHWQVIGDSRVLVTDTRVQVSDSFHGPTTPGSELTIRTLGGELDKIAQLVHGEARLALGTSCFLFLDEGSDGILRINQLAQGEYPLVADAKGQLLLVPSPGLDMVVNVERSAVRQLAGKRVSEAANLVRGGHYLP